MSNQKATIAIIGAGPGVGFAVAACFAREGFAVALLSRDRAKLDPLVARLAAEYDVPVQAYAVDVLDHALLVDTLGRVESELGPIEAIEFSPTVSPATLRSPQEITVDNERYHLELQVLAPIAAVGAVLPAMLRRQRGSLLFTTAASAQYPAAMTASFGVAAGGLLNYVRLLHADLGPRSIRVGLVSIAGLVAAKGAAEQGDFPPGIPIVDANDVAELHWRIHAGTGSAFAYAGDIDLLLGNRALYPEQPT